MTELRHHGILGMKWGVRRYQNKDGTLTAAGKKRYSGDTVAAKNLRANEAKMRPENVTQEHTIPKGTVLYRTTATDSDSPSGMYFSYLDVDRDHYNSGWIRQTGKSESAYEHSYKTTEDLKIPSRETVNDVIKQVMQDDKISREVVQGLWEQIAPKGSLERLEYTDAYMGDPEHPMSENKAWKKFVDRQLSDFKGLSPDQACFQVSQSLGLAPSAKKKIVSRLSELGYNAMVDEASVGGRYGWGKEGVEPLMLFDRSALQTVSTRRITGEEENESRTRYNQWRREANQNKSASWGEKL